MGPLQFQLRPQLDQRRQCLVDVLAVLPGQPPVGRGQRRVVDRRLNLQPQIETDLPVPSRRHHRLVDRRPLPAQFGDLLIDLPDSGRHPAVGRQPVQDERHPQRVRPRHAPLGVVASDQPVHFGFGLDHHRDVLATPLKLADPSRLAFDDPQPGAAVVVEQQRPRRLDPRRRQRRSMPLQPDRHVPLLRPLHRLGQPIGDLLPTLQFSFGGGDLRGPQFRFRLDHRLSRDQPFQIRPRGFQRRLPLGGPHRRHLRRLAVDRGDRVHLQLRHPLLRLGDAGGQLPGLPFERHVLRSQRRQRLAGLQHRRVGLHTNRLQLLRVLRDANLLGPIDPLHRLPPQFVQPPRRTLGPLHRDGDIPPGVSGGRPSFGHATQNLQSTRPLLVGQRGVTFDRRDLLFDLRRRIVGR